MISKIYCHPILLLILTCSFLFSCSNSSTEDSQNQPTESEANSETVTVDETENKSGECPEKPGKLNSSNVEKVNLDQSETTVSGQLIAGEALGYSFEGKENQKLIYSTEDEFCMWIYTPDNDILEGLELPKNGSYTVQISIPKGAKMFELAMQLRNPESSDTANKIAPNDLDKIPISAGHKKQLYTDNYTVKIINKCQNNKTICDEIHYQSENINTNESINLKGREIYKKCNDQLISCQFLRYDFYNGNYRYSVTKTGLLKVYKNSELLLHEEGEWN